MTMNKEVAELPSMLIQRWRAEAAAHEKRAKELGYGHPLFAHGYEKNAAQKIECAAQLESALSASAEPAAPHCTCPSGDGSLRWPCPQHPPTESLGRNALSGWDDEIRDLILQYGSARAADNGRGSWQEQKDALNASANAYSKILDHLELRATPPASAEPVEWQFRDMRWKLGFWSVITRAMYDSYNSGNVTGKRGEDWDIRTLYAHAPPASCNPTTQPASVPDGLRPAGIGESEHVTVMTYTDQPGNLEAWRLGEARARSAPGGDYIDGGLSLLCELHARGYGVVRVARYPSTTTPEPRT